VDSGMLLVSWNGGRRLMSRVTRARCDHCGKEVPVREARDWLVFWGFDFTVASLSRKEIDHRGNFSFCSEECTTGWIKGLYIERRRGQHGREVATDS